LTGRLSHDHVLDLGNFVGLTALFFIIFTSTAASTTVTIIATSTTAPSTTKILRIEYLFVFD
jgi:hypothetical protein